MKKVLSLFRVQFLGILTETVNIGRSNKKRPKRYMGLYPCFL